MMPYASPFLQTLKMQALPKQRRPRAARCLASRRASTRRATRARDVRSAGAGSSAAVRAAARVGDRAVHAVRSPGELRRRESAPAPAPSATRAYDSAAATPPPDFVGHAAERALAEVLDHGFAETAAEERAARARDGAVRHLRQGRPGQLDLFEIIHALMRPRRTCSSRSG